MENNIENSCSVDLVHMLSYIVLIRYAEYLQAIGNNANGIVENLVTFIKLNTGTS